MHELLMAILKGGAFEARDRHGERLLHVLMNSEGDVLITRFEGTDVQTLYMLRPDDKLIPVPVIEEGCLERARAACPE